MTKTINFKAMTKKMTNKELLKELSEVVNQMEECFGTYELYWRQAIENELDRRDITPSITFS